MHLQQASYSFNMNFIVPQNRNYLEVPDIASKHDDTKNVNTNT